MTRAVINTNVLISALLAPGSKPGQVLSRIYSGELHPITSIGMLKEYADVLRRPKFNFDASEITAVLDYFGRSAFTCQAEDYEGLTIPEDDAVFAAAARRGLAEYIITGNIKHFEKLKNEKFVVVTPGEFLNI